MLQQLAICIPHVIDYKHNSRSRLDRSVELPVNTNAIIKIIMNSGHVNVVQQSMQLQLWPVVYITPTSTTSLVPSPYLHAKNGLVRQVQILGHVPQNKERPIKLQNDYIITSE